MNTRILVPWNVDVSYSIPEKRVADLLCSAFEGGSAYWCQMERCILGKGDGNPWGDGDEIIRLPDSYRAAFSTDGAVLLHDTEADEEDGLSPNPYRLDREAMCRGLKVMAEKYPKHFADFINEDDDATTGDVFLQCALFGEIRYG